MAKRRLIGDRDEASGGVDNVLPPRRPGLERGRATSLCQTLTTAILSAAT